MKTILAATAAMGLAIAAVPAAAQMDDMSGGDMAMVEMNTQQQAMYDSWPKGKQLAYDGWSNETKAFFWTLGPAEMQGWWLLTPDQQSKIMTMTPEAQARAWASIKSQVASAPASDSGMSGTNSGTSSSTSASTSAPRYVSNEMVQTVDSANAAGDDYPVCTKTRTDNCRNPGSV